MPVQPLVREDPLEEGMATHCNILAWRISWTEELAGYGLWGHRESDKTECLTLSLSWFSQGYLIISPTQHIDSSLR